MVPLQVATRLVAAFRPSNIANSPLFALRIVRAPRPGTLAAVYEDWARPALVPSSPARSRTILVQSINRSPLASVFDHSTDRLKPILLGKGRSMSCFFSPQFAEGSFIATILPRSRRTVFVIELRNRYTNCIGSFAGMGLSLIHI